LVKNNQDNQYNFMHFPNTQCRPYTIYYGVWAKPRKLGNFLKFLC